MSLADDYHRLCAEPSDINEHLPTLVDLVEMTHAQHVIELGTRDGVSTVAFLYALEQTGGRLTSVDIDQAPDLPEHPQWQFIQGDDCDPAVFGQLEPADIVFIDTSHFYEHTKQELNLYRWLVKPGGVIVCHDTELPRPLGAPAKPAYPVKTAIHEFCADNDFKFENRHNNNGLGIIRLESGPGFIEDWFSPWSCDTLASLGRAVQYVEGDIVEIGAWEGRSTVVLANTVHPRKLHTIDTWAGSPDEISERLAAVRDVHRQWRLNVDTYTQGNVVEHRYDWRQFQPDTTALLFIDAEHTYTEVHDTIVAWLPHMAPGGIICGDDAHHPPVQRAVMDTLHGRNITQQASLWIWRNDGNE